MKRITKVAAVSAAALGLVAGATPAEADFAAHAGAVVFIGSAQVNPGLSTPGLPVAISPDEEGRDGTWSLSNAGGLPNLGLGAATTGHVGAATINATGALHVGLVNVFGPGAFCGLSGGSDGTGSIGIDGSSVNIRDVGWFQSAATVIAFTGDTTFVDGHDPNNPVTRVGGALVGVVSAIPPIEGVVGTGACSDGTATQFTVVGAGASTFTVFS